MRKTLVFALLLTLGLSSAALAGIPDPSRSGCEVVGMGSSCHFRFTAAASLDTMTLKVTLRDAFFSPVASCSTSATVVNSGGAPFFCMCCPNPKTGTTDAGGVVNFYWEQIAGYGNVDIEVTAHCTGNIAICTETITYTNAGDLNGSCETSNTSTNIIDLGIWATAITPYQQYGDYNCDLTVNIIDLGIWATGLGNFCGSAACK
jgi:hypothetical protein